MSQELSLVVLAAGMGSRYGGLKQIEPVGPSGEIVIDYSIHDALRAGFRKIVFVIRRDIEALFREKVGSRFDGAAEIAYVYQELDALPAGFTVPEGRAKPWGTGQAVLPAAAVVDGPFAVINADDFYGRHGFEMLARFLGGAPVAGRDWCMVAFPLRNTLSEHGTVSRGVCEVSPEGMLRSIEEMTKVRPEGAGAVQEDAGGALRPLTGDEPVSMNLWGFTPSLFAELEARFRRFLEMHGAEAKSEFYLPAAVGEAVDAGDATVRVFLSPDTWCGVTYPPDKAAVVARIGELVRAGVYPERIEFGRG